MPWENGWWGRIDKDFLMACLGVVRVLKVPETGAKRKLLDAAEMLVVEKGFDLVSVRDVTGAVKANVAAVNYHFGTREGMLDLVVARVLAPLCEERLKRLNKVERDAGVDVLVEAYVGGLGVTASRMGMELGYFLKLCGRVEVLGADKMPMELAVSRERVAERFVKALSGALPDLPQKELAVGWKFFEAGLGQAMTGIGKKDDAEELLAYWSGFGVKGLCGAGAAPVVKKDDGQALLFEF